MGYGFSFEVVLQQQQVKGAAGGGAAAAAVSVKKKNKIGKKGGRSEGGRKEQVKSKHGDGSVKHEEHSQHRIQEVLGAAAAAAAVSAAALPYGSSITTTSPDATATAASAGGAATTGAEEVDDNNDDDDASTAALNAQLRFDPLFKYLHQASLFCPGGFQDWCCVCTQAKNIIIQEKEEGGETEGEGERVNYSRVAWFAHVICCRRKEDAAATAGAAAAPALSPMAGSTHPWRPEDDLPFYPPPRPLPGAAAAAVACGGRRERIGCALRLDGKRGGLMVVAAPAAAPALLEMKEGREHATLWQMGTDRKDPSQPSSSSFPSSSSSSETTTVGFVSAWTCFLILSSLLLVMGGVILSWRERQGRIKRWRKGARKGGDGEEEGETAHLMLHVLPQMQRYGAL
jgi:hypothetical protein